MGSRFQDAKYLKRAFIFLVAMACGSWGVGSTLVQLSFSEVAAQAQYIFEGEVIASESQYVADGSIRTFVRFQINDVLKGEYSGDTIDLSYLGGQVGTRHMQVSDMQTPTIGEVGIYFVESIDLAMPSPLVGWAQGHYIIVNDNGQSTMQTASGSAVIGINEPDNSVSQNGGISSGLAKGVIVPKSALSQGLSRPMSVNSFKDSIRDVLQEQQR